MLELASRLQPILVEIARNTATPDDPIEQYRADTLAELLADVKTKSAAAKRRTAGSALRGEPEPGAEPPAKPAKAAKSAKPAKPAKGAKSAKPAKGAKSAGPAGPPPREQPRRAQ